MLRSAGAIVQPDTVIDQILQAAVDLSGGDLDKARRWFEQEPLREFDGRPAAPAVADGRGGDVLRLIDISGQGFLTRSAGARRPTTNRAGRTPRRPMRCYPLSRSVL